MTKYLLFKLKNGCDPRTKCRLIFPIIIHAFFGCRKLFWPIIMCVCLMLAKGRIHLIRSLPLAHISHNAPYLSPKILHKHCFQFLLGRAVISRRNDCGFFLRGGGVGKGKGKGQIRCFMGVVQVANSKHSSPYG